MDELSWFFLHVDANSGKLRVTLIIFEWFWSKRCMGLTSEWMDESSWSFYMLIIFMKARSYFNSYWVSLVKYGLLGHGAL